MAIRPWTGRATQYSGISPSPFSLNRSASQHLWIRVRCDMEKLRPSGTCIHVSVGDAPLAGPGHDGSGTALGENFPTAGATPVALCEIPEVIHGVKRDELQLLPLDVPTGPLEYQQGASGQGPYDGHAEMGEVVVFSIYDFTPHPSRLLRAGRNFPVVHLVSEIEKAKGDVL